MQTLLTNLQSPDVHRNIKPQILSAFGDIALAIGDRFDVRCSPRGGWGGVGGRAQRAARRARAGAAGVDCRPEPRPPAVAPWRRSTCSTW